MINKIIDSYLLNDQKSRGDRVRSGKFNPSSFGRCLRYQIWNRQNQPQSNPADLKGIKRMLQGTYTHKLVQSCFPEDMCEVLVETDDTKGYADIVFPDRVDDIKSTDDFGFKKYWNTHINYIIKEKRMQFFQVTYYGMELNKSDVSLVGCVFGTFRFVTHTIPTDMFAKDVESELKELRDYWNRKVLPPKNPVAFGGKECAYCCYRTKCKEDEDGRF